MVATGAANGQDDATSRAGKKDYTTIGSPEIFLMSCASNTSYLITTPQGPFHSGGGFVETAPK